MPARRPRRGEQLVAYGLLAFALVSVLTTAGIVLSLLGESVAFFREVSIVEFLTDTRWTPLFSPQHFGILPLLAGTLMITGGAAAIALPLGVATAIYLSEYAGERRRRILKPVLEILAGVPTVVYGYFALTFVTPILQRLLPQTEVFNAASAAIVVGIMITPMIASLSEDAMLTLPRSLREGAYALGATRFEVTTRALVPAAMPSIVSAFVLALSRAIGETMIVTIAAGATPRLTLNPLESIQTMTAYIVQVSLGDTPFGSLEYKTMFAVGMTLFAITLAGNVLARRIVGRPREV